MRNPRARLWLILVIVAGMCGRPSYGDQLPPSELFVAGYTDALSYQAGDQVRLHLSTNGGPIDIRVQRLGAETVEVMQHSGVSAELATIPDRASSTGCNWPVAYQFAIPDAWRSGYYEAQLSTVADGQTATSKLFFVVRAADSGPHAKILLQLATNTYNAYTNWGGHSLYAYHDRDGLQGHRVSFDRPLASQYAKWEHPFVRWAETQGFELDFAVNTDLELRPEILQHYSLVLSVGHDEYWSTPMRDALENYIAGGGNVAFFSGNTCCWQVRSEDNGRALTCWKQAFNSDPLFRSDQQHLLSTAWGHHLVQRPENKLTGVGFLWGGYHLSHGQFMDGDGAFRVHRPDHWMLAGTDLKVGDRFGAQDTIVGYECDGCELEWRDGVPFPTGRDGTPSEFEVLATCPARWAPDDCYWYDRFPKDRVGNAVMGTYTQGGTVFTCGSTDWAHGLAGNDPSVVQITKNILERLSQ